MAYNRQQAVTTWTMDYLLMLESKYNIVPDGIDLEKWKENDASSDLPYCEEEPDGSLQFYNSYSGRPCRKLCDFEKDLLEDFYRYMKPGLPVPSFKDLECWRQQLNSPNMDLCDKYIRDRLTPAQKEERDESIEKWRRMMHDRFWHKERRCNCRAHLYRRSEKRFDEEPDIVEMIKSVQLGHDYRKSAKSTSTPSTPVKAIKEEPIDTPSASRVKDKEKAQQHDEGDAEFDATKKSTSKGKGRKKTQLDADDDSDFEPSKKSSSKDRKSGTAINNTPTRKGKAAVKDASTPDALSSNNITSKKRKTPSKDADTTDIGVDNQTPTKKRKSTQQVRPPGEIPTIVVTPAKKKSRNINLVAEHPDIIEALVESVLEDMNTAAATQNKTPEQIVMEWSKQDGIDVYWKGPEMPKKPSARSFVQDPRVPNKKSSSAGKKRVKGLKADEDDNMLRVPPTTTRRRSIVNNILSGKPSAEARKQSAKVLKAKEGDDMLRAPPTAASKSSVVNNNLFDKTSSPSSKERAKELKAKKDHSIFGDPPTAAHKSSIINNNLFGKASAPSDKRGAKVMKAKEDDNMLRASPITARKSSIVNKNIFSKPYGERVHGLLTESMKGSLEDPFSSSSQNYYNRQGLNQARRYEMLQAVRAPQDIKPRLPMPQTPPPKPARFENGNIAMPSMTPNYVVAGPEMTPSRMLHFDGLTLGEQEFHSPGFTLTPSPLVHFDGLRLGEGEFYSQGPEMTPSRMLHFDGLTLGEEEFHSQNQELMRFANPQSAPSTSTNAEFTVELAGDYAPTEGSKLSEKKIFTAPPTAPSISTKRKSTVKDVSNHAPTKKSNSSEKKIFTAPLTTQSTPMKRKSTVKSADDRTPTRKSTSSEKNISTAPPTTPSTSMKRKSTVKDARDYTPTKKSKSIEKEIKKNAENTANEGVVMMGASKEAVKVEKSNNIMF